MRGTEKLERVIFSSLIAGASCQLLLSLRASTSSRTKSFVTFERANFQALMWFLFSFVPPLPMSRSETVTEMPTVISLSKRMKERCVFCRLTQLFLFFPSPVSLDFPSTHIMISLRVVALAAAMSLALLAQGGLVRFGERGSRRVKWFRLGEITTKASSRDRS
jgi:hypothetical protein